MKRRDQFRKKTLNSKVKVLLQSVKYIKHREPAVESVKQLGWPQK